MMKSIFFKKSVLCSLLYFAVASCGGGKEYEGIFDIFVVPPQMAVVPAPRRSCADIYSDPLAKSVGSASVGFSSFMLTWKETTRDLYIVKIQLDVEASILATKIDITDPDEIGTMFGVGSLNDVKIPRLGGVGATTTGLYRSDFKDFNGDLAMDSGQLSCPLAFGGMSLPEDTDALIGGFVRVLAIAQDDSNNQEVIRLAIPIKLLIATD